MQNDRSFYRMCDDKRLINEVRDSIPSSVNWQELAIVLAERLQDAIFDVEHGHSNEIAELERIIAELRDELEEAEKTITYYETQENDQ